jgi:hypothetical protein
MRRLIEAISETAWTPILYRIAGVPMWPRRRIPPFAPEKDAKPVRLIVRRVKPTPGSQLALFALYDFHAFITDRDGETLELEVDHRRHPEIENAIQDLKYGVGPEPPAVGHSGQSDQPVWSFRSPRSEAAKRPSRSFTP